MKYKETYCVMATFLRLCSCASYMCNNTICLSHCLLCVEMMTLLLIFYFFVSYLVFDILENN